MKKQSETNLQRDRSQLFSRYISAEQINLNSKFRRDKPDESDTKMIWINVIQRGFGPIFHGDQTQQQDKSVVEHNRSTPRTIKQILANQQAKPTILVSPDMGPFSCLFLTPNSTPLTLVRTPLAL
jgi:hypothetical protein